MTVVNLNESSTAVYSGIKVNQFSYFMTIIYYYCFSLGHDSSVTKKLTLFIMFSRQDYKG